jgi:hypothetical protein
MRHISLVTTSTGHEQLNIVAWFPFHFLATTVMYILHDNSALFKKS